jgi:hypothetical protein
MSLVVCEECDAYIDSDFDCECFVEVGRGGERTLCERCRDKFFEELERQANEGPL